MKRIALALALAGASFAASALPPPGMGTPLNVNVTNPAVPVQVKNVDPVPVRDADTAAFQPFSSLKTLIYGDIPERFQELAIVPSGKRLVIEHVSWKCVSNSKDWIVDVSLFLESQGELTFAALLMPINPSHPWIDATSFAQEGAEMTRLYFEPGQRIVWRVKARPYSFYSCNLAAYGHYVNL